MNKKNPDHRTLENVLRQIYVLDVALESSHLEKKQLLMAFLENFKDYSSSNNAVFHKYFGHFYFTGSYFEGLRVKEATEFDVNVVFNFPFSESSYMVTELDVPLSFATIQFKSDDNKDFNDVPIFDAKGYLVGQKILNWFQSLLDLFIKSSHGQCPGARFIRTSNSGPARTVKVLYGHVWISIDLVPVFQLSTTYLKKYTMCDCLQLSEAISTCYVVPKPLKPELACLLPSSVVSDQVWRIHFPEAEKIILADYTWLKRVIKLVKALRDKEEWPIPSYLLKVVAFSLVKKYPSKIFQDEKDVGVLFILYLQALEGHLAVGHLGHIFYPKFNLFHSLNKKLLRNLHVRVKNIVGQLQHQPKSAFGLFKTMDSMYISLVPSLFYD